MLLLLLSGSESAASMAERGGSKPRKSLVASALAEKGTIAMADGLPTHILNNRQARCRRFN